MKQVRHDRVSAYLGGRCERFMRAIIPVLRSGHSPCDDLYPHYPFNALLNPAEEATIGIFYEFRGLDY